jgi:hypothetical protein
MAHGHKTNQFPRPTAITGGPKNIRISRFQIVFGVETNSRQGTLTCRAPEEEYVRELGGSHHNCFLR